MTFTNCIVPEDGHRNNDGYVRVLDKMRKDGGRLTMLHRMEWEKVNEPIPEGYTINHLCKNRECQNVNHMECLPHSEHITKDNSLRYIEKVIDRLKYMVYNPGLTQVQYAEKFGISFQQVSRYMQLYPETKSIKKENY